MVTRPNDRRAALLADFMELTRLSTELKVASVIREHLPIILARYTFW